jgi:hypothetical protein
MRELAEEGWQGLSYHGSDIVPEIIERNRRVHAAEVRAW